MGNSTLDETLTPNSNMTSVIENNEPESLQLYRSVIQEIVANIFSTVGVEELSSDLIHHSFYQKNPKMIEKLHSHMMQSISTKMSGIVERQIKHDKLEEKFNRLKEIMESTPASNTPAWRPSHNVEENVKAYIMQDKINYREKLKYMVSKKEDAIDKTKFEVSTARDRANKINARLGGLFDNLSYVNEKCDEYLSKKDRLLEKYPQFVLWVGEA